MYLGEPEHGHMELQRGTSYSPAGFRGGGCGGGVTIYRCLSCIVIGTYAEEQGRNDNFKTVGEIADHLKGQGF